MDDRLIGGRYRLRDARATGGMASIWRATDERTGDEVAVKLLHPHLAASDDARARLEREAAALGAIDHPNVVAVREVVFDDGGPAVVMDYVEGVSLAERLADGVPVAEPEALRIALDVTEALRAVHGTGLVHRDVKPGNVLLGADGRTRLIDFGIATDIDGPADLTALTAADDVIGTLRYLAPERLAGQAATARTDLWGVGVVLYEMLAGEPAYPSAAIMDRASSATALPARPANVGDEPWAIIASAMALDPDARPVDATALAGALRALVGDGDEPALPATDPWADTMTIAVPAAALGARIERDAPASAPAGPVAWSPTRLSTAAVEASQAFADRTPRHRHRPALAAGLGALVLAVAMIAAASLAGPASDDAALVAPTRSAPVAPSPEPSATSEPVEADDEAGGDGNGNRGGNGKGKGNDKDD